MKLVFCFFIKIQKLFDTILCRTNVVESLAPKPTIPEVLCIIIIIITTVTVWKYFSQ